MFALCITCAFPWHPSPRRVRERIRAKEQAAREQVEVREDFRDVEKRYNDIPTKTDVEKVPLGQEIKAEAETET